MTEPGPLAGPYIRAALFCERVLREADGVVSIIRVVDQVTHTVVGPQTPDYLPAFTYRLFLYVSVTPGEARGRTDYAITMEKPDGLRHPVAQSSFNFAGGPSQGNDLAAELQVQFDQEGLYWFDISVDGRVLTRMPLRILYARFGQGVGPAA